MKKPALFHPRNLLSISLACTLAALSGCHSRFVEVTISNQANTNLSMIEVDYPSASFGVGNLAPDKQFHYRFKIQGSGPLKIEFTDAVGKTHKVDGPELSEGQEGHLAINIDANGRVDWQPTLASPK